MTFKQWWACIVVKNPALAQSKKVTILPENVRRLCEQSYQMGREEDGIGQRITTTSLFEDVFGKK